MRQTKRILMLHQIYDRTAVERRLEQLALQGWALESMSGSGLYKFRRIDPAPLRYTVVYFPDASEFDPEPTEQQAVFIDLCAQSGWEYVDHRAQMLVFCSSEPDPIPIETDAAMQVDTVHKAMKKNFLPAQFLLAALSLMQFGIQRSIYKSNPLNWLSSDTNLVIISCYAMIILMCGVHLTAYYLWRRKALRAAEDGIFVETISMRWLDMACLVAVTIITALWLWSLRQDMGLLAVALEVFLAILMVYVVAFGAKWLMQKYGVNAKFNRIITFLSIGVAMVFLIVIVGRTIMSDNDVVALSAGEPVGSYEFAGYTVYVYDEPIPLTLEDLGAAIDYPNQSRIQEVNESLLLTVYSGRDISPWGQAYSFDLEYSLYIPRFAGMLDTCLDAVLEDLYGLYANHQLGDAALWEAQMVYVYDYDQVEGRRCVVVWPDRVMTILFPDTPTEEQIRATVDALKTYEVQ